MTGERINRYLARCGLGARRAVERLVLTGKVSVNGAVVKNLGRRINPDDVVTVNGRRVVPPRSFQYYAFFKPRGVITTASDAEKRRTVKGVLPPQLRRLKPVGRLDADTQGLLLLTDDGTFAQIVAHPSFGVRKIYVVDVENDVTPEDVRAFERGIKLPDGHMGRLEVMRVVKRRRGCRVTVSAVYGRKRMIREMFAARHLTLAVLTRVAIGPVRLGKMRPREFRPLTSREIEWFFRIGDLRSGYDNHSAGWARGRG